MTASGILALTQSPLLFKGRANANRKTASFAGEAFGACVVMVTFFPVKPTGRHDTSL